MREYAMQPIIELNNINLIINQKMLLPLLKRCVFFHSTRRMGRYYWP
ncbi:hypothetical protein JG559_04515 [Enterococcus faecalis]|uniref:Uncharacterized protein n=1 Tax=Enterococcus faecalis TaxID=1351 RepID=A0A974NZA7_ENTFL|nr:hypothetical protein JG559_04515 [Enterococcus faecalis]